VSARLRGLVEGNRTEIEEFKIGINRDVIVSIQPGFGPDKLLLRIDDIDNKEPEYCSIWTILEFAKTNLDK